MNFIHEYKKCLACIMLVIFLIVLQIVTGHNTYVWVSKTLETMTFIFAAGAVKNSVMKTSEREALRDNLPTYDDDESDAVDNNSYPPNFPNQGIF